MVSCSICRSFHGHVTDTRLRVCVSAHIMGKIKAEKGRSHTLERKPSMSKPRDKPRQVRVCLKFPGKDLCIVPSKSQRLFNSNGRKCLFKSLLLFFNGIHVKSSFFHEFHMRANVF